MPAHKKHAFRISVERLGASEAPAEDRVSFEVQHHDDVLDIIHRVSAGTTFSADDARALALGLKLFSGVMLAHRSDPLFSSVQPSIREFIGNLKSRVASTIEERSPEFRSRDAPSERGRQD
ncbi:MAG: DUF3861 domain-containing protein [Ramlibacter sp.]|nr:DUF3861 domain-containing protein [Ramlibacter sp.]